VTPNDNLSSRRDVVRAETLSAAATGLWSHALGADGAQGMNETRELSSLEGTGEINGG